MAIPETQRENAIVATFDPTDADGELAAGEVEWFYEYTIPEQHLPEHDHD